jgi:hypothetical protein
VRRFVHRQGEQQDDERNEDLREVDIQQDVTLNDYRLKAIVSWRDRKSQSPLLR